MKRTIRNGAFETNSSSTHCITICTKEEYDKWQNDENIFVDWYGEFFTKEQVAEKIGYEITDDFDIDDFIQEAENESYYRPENLGGEYYETFTSHYTTPGGENVVAFGFHGYCG